VDSGRNPTKTLHPNRIACINSPVSPRGHVNQQSKKKNGRELACTPSDRLFHFFISDHPLSDGFQRRHPSPHNLWTNLEYFALI
jgi:hypothetical protein